jgi:RimJ/RimL family protein N-acetyltransferase
MADEKIVRNLSTAPWPYTLRDALTFLTKPRDSVLPSLLIFARTKAEPTLVGACGLARRPSGAVEIGYWIGRPHWGQGFATEACTALIQIARMLGLGRLEASHFLDNPASGRVLEKLHFEPLGITTTRASCARAAEAPARLFRLNLDGAKAKEAMAA